MSWTRHEKQLPVGPTGRGEEIMAKKKKEPEQKPGLFKRFGDYIDRMAEEEERKKAEQDRIVSEVTASVIQQLEQRRGQILKRITAITSQLERHQSAGLTDCLLHRCDTCRSLIADRDALYDELAQLS
jgi:hypothetical protein